MGANPGLKPLPRSEAVFRKAMTRPWKSVTERAGHVMLMFSSSISAPDALIAA
jgi:hypothetical protein